jgi:hypothetical protein
MNPDIVKDLDQLLKKKTLVAGIILIILVISGVIWINSDEASVIYLLSSIMMLLCLSSLVISSMVFSIIINKMKTAHSIEFVKDIFKNSDDTSDTYTFPIIDDEINVELKTDGFEIQGKMYHYEDYEISLSAISLSRVIEISLEFIHKDIEAYDKEITFEQSFCILFNRRVYQVMKEFELSIDDDSKKRLELLKNETEETVKKVLTRGYLKV